MIYALQLNNIYKVGWMSYLYEIRYLYVLQVHGMVGGNEDLYKAVPMITGTPTVLIGQGYLILFAELENIGEIYACVVEDNDDNNLTPPSSRQIYRGKNGFNNDCKVANSSYVQEDSFHQLSPA